MSGPAPEAAARLDRRVAAALVVLALALHGARLDGPLTDGNHGNCGAMFAIFVRNAEALGLTATGGVPVLDPVPPATPEQARYYTNHPPGLAWLHVAAARLPLAVETAGRLVALVLTTAGAVLAARLAGACASRRRAQVALAAGALFLALPAGLHHGLLVNYETIAMPALMALLAALVLPGAGTNTGTGPSAGVHTSAGADTAHAALAGLGAALADWIALLPLATCAGALLVPGRSRRRWLAAAAGAVAGIVLFAALAAGRSSGSLAVTLDQARRASFLGPEFEAGAWWRALGGHVGALYLGWWTVAAAAVGCALAHRPARRIAHTLALAGVLNVTLFAQHATGHETFSLLLLPAVAVGLGVLLLGGRLPAAGGWAAVALLLLLSARARAAETWRDTTVWAARGRAFGAAAEPHYVYVVPDGVPFVFLHAAARHVSPYGATDRASAWQRALDYQTQFGLTGRPARVALPDGVEPPDWVGALGPGSPRGPFRVFELPAP